MGLDFVDPGFARTMSYTGFLLLVLLATDY